MSITEIEKAIKDLPATEVNELMDWFAAYHAEIWDRQMADDLSNGRLYSVLADVNSEIDSGLAKPL